MKRVELEEYGFHHPLNYHLEQQTKIQEVIRVSCPDILKDESIYDPNKDLKKEETKRLTITDPKFYISLHSEHL